MCGAAVRAKCPASPVVASVAEASKPSKLSRKTAEEKMKPPPPQEALANEPYHPSGIVVEIVGTERGDQDQGRSYEEHINCGEVMAEDVVVCLLKVQILV